MDHHRLEQCGGPCGGESAYLIFRYPARVITHPLPAAVRTFFLCLLLVTGTGSLRADWREELSSPEPGGFPPLRPVKLVYQCGWAGLNAGRVEVEFLRPSPNICVLEAKAMTTGLARALWRLDAMHVARANVSTDEAALVAADGDLPLPDHPDGSGL